MMKISASQVMTCRKSSMKHRLALYGIEEADGTFTVTHRINRPFGQPLVVTATVDGILLPKFIGSVVAPPNDFPLWG
ncbi:MAG: hypothetical protein IPF52_16545 [Saprospiraceae bacterium]|nr:hypothetical protein [Saprospiraceae bacterium]